MVFKEYIDSEPFSRNGIDVNLQARATLPPIQGTPLYSPGEEADAWQQPTGDSEKLSMMARVLGMVQDRTTPDFAWYGMALWALVVDLKSHGILQSSHRYPSRYRVLLLLVVRERLGEF
jgi:hypothetical protein